MNTCYYGANSTKIEEISKNLFYSFFLYLSDLFLSFIPLIYLLFLHDKDDGIAGFIIYFIISVILSFIVINYQHKKDYAAHFITMVRIILAMFIWLIDYCCGKTNELAIFKYNSDNESAVKSLLFIGYISISVILFLSTIIMSQKIKLSATVSENLAKCKLELHEDKITGICVNNPELPNNDIYFEFSYDKVRSVRTSSNGYSNISIDSTEGTYKLLIKKESDAADKIKAIYNRIINGLPPFDEIINEEKTEAKTEQSNDESISNKGHCKCGMCGYTGEFDHYCPLCGSSMKVLN